MPLSNQLSVFYNVHLWQKAKSFGVVLAVVESTGTEIKTATGFLFAVLVF